MSQDMPELEDYVQMFALYGDDLGSIDKDPPDGRYELLFQRAIRLLVKPSPFNLSLPATFRVSAERYRSGDPVTMRQLDDLENRHFMLCDLHDYVMLKRGLARRRQSARP